MEEKQTEQMERRRAAGQDVDDLIFAGECARVSQR